MEGNIKETQQARVWLGLDEYSPTALGVKGNAEVHSVLKLFLTRQGYCKE